jgi:lysyl-tRNA synthetase class 2
MSDPADTTTPSATPEPSISDQAADRRKKLGKLRDEFKIDPYGQRVDGLITLAAAVAVYDADADAAQQANKEDDRRPVVAVAGRVVLHRDIGKLVFMTVRDASGDIQIAANKRALSDAAFNLAKIVDLGDVVVAIGPLAKTKTGEITVWATSPTDGKGVDGFAIATKSLAPAPGKWEGLQDPELRYRKRYVDLYANPKVMQTMQTRSRILKATRDFFFERDFLEVETPMMQPIPGGAAARPFITHHNALDIDLYMRIAPELYLKRLLVGGMPRVFEINRNFRNEGIDRSHNPEFTMLELYEAFGDLYSVLDHTEQLFQHIAKLVKPEGGDLVLPFDEHMIDYGHFRRAKYLDLFEEHNGFAASDHAKLVERAKELHLQVAVNGVEKAHDLLVNEVWEETVESHLIQPTFVIDYPASLCPLTKCKPTEPQIAERFELFIAGMELANAYTELNDPDVQQANFEQQITGEDDEAATFRNVDHDFLEALRVGMPPAGGLGIGIDRLVMLMTNNRSIRDVILFPLMRPQ